MYERKKEPSAMTINAKNLTVRQVGQFLLHLVEMVAVMCGGAVILNLLVFWVAALIGYLDLNGQFPELATLVYTVNLSLPMTAWMRFRGMEWRPTLEMAGAPIGVGILLMVALAIGLVTNSDLFMRQCGLSCLAMLAVMLFRFDHYTGRMDHHAAHQGM
jgi:hypothetical protein